ncbi:dihydroxyacetone kinase subunit L [Candidatus Bathyarchaeota archaeon]|nr:dihydroxyacetone kinase subunit L [Candidatus Bathyarchaeota archaeon]
MKELSLNAIELIVKAMADTAIANEKYLSDLDGVVGDADFGLSLATGFQIVLNQWSSIDRSSISSFLINISTIIMNNVGGVSGPIWGTAFMRAGIKAKDKTSITPVDLEAMLRSAIEGIMALGGAKLGDKTLLDAIAPATDKIAEWADTKPDDFINAFQAAADAATKAIESTRNLIAKRGRQSYTGERSKGTLDPGIVAVAIMWQAAAKVLKETYK